MKTLRLADHVTLNAPAAVEGLSPADRQAYSMIPSEVEHVSHPTFSSPSTEDKLFGPESPVIDVPHWNSFPETADEPSQVKVRRTVLKGQDEVTLFMRYNYAMYRLGKLIRTQRRRQSPTRAGQMLMWHRRAMEARTAIVGANMALVVSMAKRSWIPNVDFPELVSEGNMALLRSVEKFDVCRGFKFSTYACRAILKSYNRMAGKSGRYYQRFPVEFDPELEQGDMQEHKRQENWSDSVDALVDILSRNRAKLSAVEQKVVLERFALHTRGKGRTLNEVGKRIGLTNERVRQIQILALEKIRSVLEDGPLVA